MRHSEKQIVRILSGFKCFDVDGGVIPGISILFKLLRPDIDPDTATFLFTPSLDSEEETKSQLILREYNNFIVSFLMEEEWLDPDGISQSIGKSLEYICQQAYENGYVPKDYFNWDVLRYHVANLNYLDYFFLPPEDYDELANLSKEARKFYYQWINTGENESDILAKYTDNLHSNKDKIRQRFPEYKVSEDYWEFFIDMAQRYYRDGLLEIERSRSKEVSEIVDIARKNYRQPSENRLVKRKRPWQCQYCQKWFERELGGNGKPRVKDAPPTT